jgi:hypothetical protein
MSGTGEVDNIDETGAKFNALICLLMNILYFMPVSNPATQ